MATRHTYADGDKLRDYLAGTSYASGWSADAGAIRLILEAASQLIDQYTDGGTFGPITETRTYDIGRGTLLQSPQYGVLDGRDAIATTESLAPVIPLDGWLVSTTTVTAYGATDRATSEVLTEGYGNDYFLMPYNKTPKTSFKLNQDTAKTLDSGQQTFTILGSWGYTADTIQVTTADAIASTTSTSVSVTSAADFGPAQAILIDAEQMYITSISGNTLTVERGVNGTTAATHSGGAAAHKVDYPPLVVQACLDIAKLFFRNRDLGSGGTIGGGDMAITTNSAEMGSVLHTLDDFRATGTTNAVVF